MYEFTIMNNSTKERTCVFGYDWKDAFQRAHINSEDWDILMRDYID